MGISIKGLQTQYIEALTSGIYVVLLMTAIVNSEESGNVIYLMILAGIGFISWLATSNRAQSIANLPTSRIASAAQGYVELYGRASIDSDNLVISPSSGISCLWYRYRIFEKYGDGWQEVHGAVSESTFEVQDGTGICRIDPESAEVLGADIRTTYKNGDKHVEELLFGGGKIYVLGEFSTLNAAPNATSLREDVSHLLADWKKDPAKLKKRFDLNHDGQIDLQEWEFARKLALRIVEKEHAQLHQASHVHMMRAPKNNRLFLISSLSPQKLRQRYLFWSYIHITVFLVAGAAAFWAL